MITINTPIHSGQIHRILADRPIKFIKWEYMLFTISIPHFKCLHQPLIYIRGKPIKNKPFYIFRHLYRRYSHSTIRRF